VIILGNSFCEKVIPDGYRGFSNFFQRFQFTVDHRRSLLTTKVLKIRVVKEEIETVVERCIRTVSTHW
jgi:hypothetical protein